MTQRNKKVNNRTRWRFTTGCLLDFDYIKSPYRLIVVDLSRQKELDANPKASQQIEFVGQLKNVDSVNADGVRCTIHILTILEKSKETQPKFSQESAKVL